MKQSKAPTRAQKILISSFRLQPGNWLVVSETKEELVIISKYTGRKKTLRKDL